ncbi:MAG: ABC transporter permease, partial [Actinomycetota bacterium]|nr:ABC transporter permease [Actinomycetota bacterium]
MARFVAGRLAALAGILLALTAIVFLLQSVVPADPVRAMVGASATRQAVEAKRKQLGVDKPLVEQYASFLGRAVKGDLSMSLHTRRPVRDDLAAFLPATLELALTATLLAIGLGLVLGLVTAGGRGGLMRFLMVGGASVPAFLLAILALLLLYARLGWMPGSGRLSPRMGAPTGPTGF